MTKKFTAQVAAFKTNADAKMLAVFRESAQRLAQEANTPTAQGGNMPVDTGFLRGTQAANIGAMPSGPSSATQGPASAEPVELVVLSAQLGDKLFIGWTANYAKYMEAMYGFMRLASQNWNATVRSVVQEVRRRYK